MLAVVGITALLAAARLTPYHPWGDDFAGYLLQARALQEGRARAEVDLNRTLLDASDRRVGPDGYPWGTPVLLAVAAQVVGWDINHLKVVGGAALLLLTAALLGLCRQFELSALATLTCCVLVLWQPWLLREVDLIGSDLPFLALCTVHLGMLVAVVRRHRDSGAPPWPLLVATGGVAAMSFSIRSNGAVLIGTTVLAAAYCLVRTAGRTWRQNLRWFLALAAAAVAVIAAYLILLPDGTEMHFRYLTFEVDSLVRRAREITQELGHFEPVQRLPEAMAPYVVLGLIPFTLAGIWRLGISGLVLGVTVAAHLTLLVIFPKGDGMRYYYPVLPPLVLLCWFGTSQIATWAGGRGGVSARARQLGGHGLQAVLTLVLLGVAVSRPSLGSETLERGPLSPGFRELVAAVRQTVPDSARLSFFRPRAMRWFSDRQALAIVEPQHLSRVDAVALFHGLDPVLDGNKQAPEAAVLASGQFTLSFRNRDFSLYVRDLRRP